MGFEKTGRVGLGDNAQPTDEPVSEPEAPAQDDDNGRADD